MELLLQKFLMMFGILSVPVSVFGKTAMGSFPCGYNYFSDAGGWFKMHDVAATVDQAKRICEFEGAELAAPKNDALKDAMMSLIYQDDLINNEVLMNVRFVHTDMNITGNMANDPEFQNLQAESIALSDDGLLKRVSPYIELPYICFRNDTRYLEINECGTTDAEYTLSNETQKCYKFYRSRNNWYHAGFTCMAEGGHLAIINSEIEAEVIRQIFEKNPADIIPGFDWKDSAFLGYYAANVSKTGETIWMTMEDQTMSEAGYADWSQSEPNNASGDEYCITTGRNGKLFDDPCWRELPFICEKRPDNCLNPISVSKITDIRTLIVIRSLQETTN
ncbi:lectin c-type domain-containing protein [Phthorimaea operculella]|nr:lectin c-type domain-containing protein [Phthorimaea operculella]